MKNKIFLILFSILLVGCSSNKDKVLIKSDSVFEKRDIFPLVHESKRGNSDLEAPQNVKYILNSKSYNLINSSLKFPLSKLWQFNTEQSLDDENPILPDPIFISSYVFVINNSGFLLKINSDKGTLIWKKQIFRDLDNTIIGTPAISGKLSNNGDIFVYVHNGNDQIIALDGNSGDMIWQRKHDLPIRGGLTFYEDILFYSDFEGNFYSVNARKGQLIWNVFLGTEYSSIYSSARPIVANGKIIVPGTGGSFFVISIKTGEVLWTDNISSNNQLPKIFHTGDIVANTIYVDNIIYIVSQSGYLSAFNINTAKELWSLPIGGVETPILSGKTIFIHGNMGLLQAIETTSGKVRWTRKFPSYIDEDAIFTDKKIAIYKGPTLVDSKLIFTNQDGKVYVIDANTGADINNLSIDELALAPIPFDKKLFFLTANGKLLAYE